MGKPKCQCVHFVLGECLFKFECPYLDSQDEQKCPSFESEEEEEDKMGKSTLQLIKELVDAGDSLLHLCNLEDEHCRLVVKKRAMENLQKSIAEVKTRYYMKKNVKNSDISGA